MAEEQASYLITGATGLVGGALANTLRSQGKKVLSVTRKTVAAPDAIQWDLMKPAPASGLSPAPASGLSPAPASGLSEVQNIRAVIHLAGDPVFGLWTAAKKRRIRDSRVTGTRNLCTYLARRKQKPDVLVCASAVGYYGSRGDQTLIESSAPGNGFLSRTCVAWEKAAQPARDAGIRVVHLRIGIVLAARGGALHTMVTPFKMGFGGRLGSGRQWMSWIALEDLIEVIQFALETPDLSGAVNAVAPNPVTNTEFTKKLGKILRRPTIFAVPRFALKMLPGKMAQEAVLASARVLPGVLADRHFGFQFPTLEHALQHALLG